MSYWLNLVNPKELQSIPGVRLSDNGISIVYDDGDWIYKRSIPFLIENEIYFLEKMFVTSFVPYAERLDRYTIKIKRIKNEGVKDIYAFKELKEFVWTALQRMNVRHGDLTAPHILVNDNHPFIIDWAESRFLDDPRPDKRIEGDKYWLDKTWGELCKE